MTRSLANVLFGTGGVRSAAIAGGVVYAGEVRSASAEEAAMLLEGACRHGLPSLRDAA